MTAELRPSCVTFPTCWVSKVVMNRGSLKGKREVKPHGTGFVGSSSRMCVSMVTKVGSGSHGDSCHVLIIRGGTRC